MSLGDSVKKYLAQRVSQLDHEMLDTIIREGKNEYAVTKAKEAKSKDLDLEETKEVVKEYIKIKKRKMP